MSLTKVYRLTAVQRLHNLLIEALVSLELAPGSVYLLLGARSRSG
jgi:hypothetical protein